MAWPRCRLGPRQRRASPGLFQRLPGQHLCAHPRRSPARLGRASPGHLARPLPCACPQPRGSSQAGPLRPACDEGPQGHRMLRTETGGVPATAARDGGGWRAAPCETRGAGAPHGRSGAQARRVLGLKAARVAVHATVPQRAGTEHGTAPSGHVLPTGLLPGGYQEEPGPGPALRTPHAARAGQGAGPWNNRERFAWSGLLFHGNTQ